MGTRENSMASKIDSTEFLKRICNLVVAHANPNERREDPVVRLTGPDELKALIDLELSPDGLPGAYEELLETCSKCMDYKVNTGHPHFFNQLFGETEPAALGGELLTAVSNTSMYTYEVAPVFAVMEDLVLKRMRSFLGWTQGDGIYLPGRQRVQYVRDQSSEVPCFPRSQNKGQRCCWPSCWFLRGARSLLDEERVFISGAGQ